MVEPIYLIVIALGTAFFLGLLRKRGTVLQAALTLAALAGMIFISGQWAWGIISGTVGGTDIFTAGMTPPLSINLYMGKAEAVLLLIVNSAAFLSTMYLSREHKKTSGYMFMLLLVFVMGLNGIILTRDLFNLFVFIEIVSIASAGLIALKSDIKQLGAGFKFIIAGALASGLMLIGIIFTYYTTGSLNIDVISGMMTPALASTGSIGLFLVFIGVILELKPFPVNGWGLDVYQAAVPPVSAIVSAGTATAMFYAFTKITAMTGGIFINASTYIGAITFVGMNILALKQKSSGRLLGYSSISQIGLLVMTYALMKPAAAEKTELILFGLLVTHALAKAG
ncbi:MAG TPA: NADH-quinone oxidoreductase subunit F, partial [Spirochaeta sp.]|nr:NADH-quinone oxidoreductase subunit F [Spirochaeta sp.]